MKLRIMDTVRTSHFIPYMERLSSLWRLLIEKGHQSVSFIERFFYCVLIENDWEMIGNVLYQRFYCTVSLPLHTG